MSGEFDELLHARASRAGAWLILCVGGLGAIFGIWHWHASFNDAFQTNAPEFQTLDQIEQARQDAMKAKDTDVDGISDYDETYVYRTSPYLKDSDSDGIDDKTELGRGTNPNCPEGKECGPNVSSTGIAVTSSATDTAQASLDAQQQAVQQMLNPTPAQVRQYLLDSGVKQGEIDTIDDATLMQMYQDSLQEAQQEKSSAAANTPQ